MTQITLSSTSVVGLDDTGSGPTVLLLHGVPGSRRVWAGVGGRLVAGGHRVLAPDLLGFGDSSRPRTIENGLGAPQQAAMLAELLEALQTGPVTVVGHDYGGPVAVTLVRDRPDLVTGLGLLATNAFPDTPIPFPLSMTTWPLVGRLAAAALFSRPSLSLMLRTGLGSPRVQLDRGVYLGDRAQVRAIATLFADALRRLDERYAPIAAALAEVAVPTFVGWGDRDPFFPVAVAARTSAAAGCPLRLYSGAGHFLPEERTDEVARDIAEFVARSLTATDR